MCFSVNGAAGTERDSRLFSKLEEGKRMKAALLQYSDSAATECMSIYISLMFYQMQHVCFCREHTKQMMHCSTLSINCFRWHQLHVHDRFSQNKSLISELRQSKIAASRRFHRMVWSSVAVILVNLPYCVEVQHCCINLYFHIVYCQVASALFFVVFFIYYLFFDVQTFSFQYFQNSYIFFLCITVSAQLSSLQPQGRSGCQ